VIEGETHQSPLKPLVERSADAAQRFWQTYLGGLESTTGFIKDRLKPAVPPVAGRYAEHRCSLEPEATARLRDLARANGAGVATLVNAAWAILLSRYSGRKDVVFGVTFSGRSPSQKDAVESLTNTLTVRIQIDPGASVAPWLEQIQRDSLAMCEHQATRVEDAIEWSGLPAGTPPFDSSVVFYDDEPLQESLSRLGGGWRQRTLRRFHRTDLPLVLRCFGEPVLMLNIGYDTNLYSEETVAAMSRHLRTILTSMCSHPDGRLLDIGMLTDSEKEMFLRPRTLGIDSSLCAHHLFEAQVRRTPGHAALEAGDEIITYDDLNHRANRLASMLRKQGVGPEDLVAVRLASMRDTIVAVLAILKAGGAFIAIDPAAPAERRARMLADACPKFTFDENTDLAGLSEQPDSELSPTADASNAAYAVFTSGSTGKPKAIVVSHRSLVNHTLAVASVYEITPSDRRLQFASLASDVFVAEIFNYLTAGATIVICPDARRSSLQEFHRLLDEQRITITAVPGSWWNIWVAALSGGSVRLPSSLRAVVVGMERADPAAFHEWRQAAGNRLRWFNAYGPAENGPTSTIYEAGTSRWESAEALPIGKPIANTTAYVLDDEGNLLPAGVAGELYVGGAGVARGYFGAPELTRARFMDDPFRAGSRLYRTGDRAFALPDGNLVFVGRVDRQVKVRGYRVELDEIEEALARHPAVTQCAVVMTGEGDRQRLGAYVVGGASKHDLRLHLLRLLPEYMIPAVWMSLDWLPLTPSGKIDRLALPPCEPEPSGMEARDTPAVAPANAVEVWLLQIWESVLGISNIGVCDSFFDLGGNSLQAATLVGRIEERVNRRVPSTVFFKECTIRNLAEYLGREDRYPSGIVPIQIGSEPPLYFIHPQGSMRLVAQKIGSDHTMIGVEIPATKLPGLKPMASEIARRIREYQPDPPYYLAGWCASGNLAYEIAQQMHDAGVPVELVVFFESLNFARMRRIRHWSDRIRWHFSDLRKKPASEIPAYVQERLGEALNRATLLTRFVRYRVWSRLGGQNPPEPISFGDDEALNRASYDYVPTEYTGEVVLFRPQIRQHGMSHDPTLGWDSVAPKLRIIDVPGDHVTMFAPPNVDVLASKLAELLTRHSARV
jgi:amino acid adenylation domain-containing protein